MIRQLGPPTFFVTFTSVEHLWNPLINALKKQRIGIVKNHDNNSIDECIDTLIKRQPIIFSRYYRHRISSLHTLIVKNNGFLSGARLFFVTKFQDKRTKHGHGLIWVQYAPIYQHYPDTNVIAFIDFYLTCNSIVFLNEKIQIQTHHHTKNFKKHKILHLDLVFLSHQLKKLVSYNLFAMKTMTFKEFKKIFISFYKTNPIQKT